MTSDRPVDDLDGEPVDDTSALGPADPAYEESLERLEGVGAPPVVAVLVTRDPGDGFEATLESLADQDYGSLSVLVIDNGGDQDPTERVADVLPTAYVKRLDADRGFGAAANEVLTAVEGAAFYLFLHDDVQLRPDTITLLVAEAFRSTAGIVGPKLVDGERPDRLRSVGYSVDPYGFASPISDPDELDQSQHDLVREVFAVSDAAMLVRADLFDTLEGFTETIPYFGEDIDLCWRARIAGASVYLCPPAVAGHDERFAERRPDEDRERLALRHEARAMLVNYSFGRLLAVSPVVVLLSLIDLIGSVLMGRFRRAGDIVSAWTWNLLNLPSLLRERARVRRIRRVRDTDYLPLMRQGSSRLSSLVRVEEGDSRLQSAARAGRGYLRDVSTGPNRAGAVVSLVAALLLVIGARELFAGHLASIREFSEFPDRASSMLSEWWTGWRDVGLGESAVAPASIPGGGLLSMLLLASTSAARRVLILAPLFVGALGAWKLFSHSSSSRARAAALVAYGLNPIALNALAEGRLQALVVYGIAPWFLRRVAATSGLVPFAAGESDRARPPAGVRRSWLARTAGTALMLAVVAAVTPLGAAILIVTVLLFAGVAGLVGERRAFGMVPTVLAAAVGAAAVCSPWLVAAVLDGDAASLTDLWAGRGAMPSAAQIMTGSIGPIQVSWFGWGVVAAAGYAALVGRGWRLRWALAGWVVAFASWGSAIALAAAGHVAGAGVEIVLVPAALGLCVAVAMGACAFEEDVIGSDFGLRQLLSAAAVVALLGGAVPVAVASAQGRWYLPEGDFDRVLSVIEADPGVRTLWIGDPDLLPVAGWPLGQVEGVSVGLSNGLVPTQSDQYRLDGGPGAGALVDAVDAAMLGETSRLGRVLAPMGVGYVIGVGRAAPQPYDTEAIPLPEGAPAALREQLDLSEFEINPAMTAFRVNGTWPPRSDVTDLEFDSVSSWTDLLRQPLATPPAVLTDGSGTQFRGELGADRDITRSGNQEDGWSLSVDGDVATAGELFGWQQVFSTTDPGAATMAWTPPASSRVLQLVQVVSLVLLVGLALRRQRSAKSPDRPRRRARRSAEPLVVVGDTTAEVSTVQPPAPGAGSYGPDSVADTIEGEPRSTTRKRGRR